MIYKEYDIPRTEQIEGYRKMSQEERDRLLKELIAESRKEEKSK